MSPGIPDDVIAKGRDYKIVTEVVQNGNEFTWTQHYPANHKVTNKFVIGQESDMETIGGKKFKVRGTFSLPDYFCLHTMCFFPSVVLFPLLSISISHTHTFLSLRHYIAVI